MPADSRRLRRPLRRARAGVGAPRERARCTPDADRAIASPCRPISTGRCSRSILPACAPGLVYLPLNTAYRKRELAFFFADATPRVIVCRPQTLGLDGARSRARRDRAHPRCARRRARRSRTRRCAALSRPCDSRAGRPRRVRLHVGNDRPLEGRVADAPQSRVERARARRSVGFHRAAISLCTRCRSTMFTGCSSPSTARCCRVRGCFGCRSSTRADVAALCPPRRVMMGVPTFYTRLLAEPAFTARMRPQRPAVRLGFGAAAARNVRRVPASAPGTRSSSATA